MKYFSYNKSDNGLYIDINSIVISCKDNNETIYELDEMTLQDFDCFILATDNGTPVGFLASSIFDEASYEIIGAVIPGRRQRGIFRKMLEEFNREFNPRKIVFSGKNTYNGFSECSYSLGYPVMDCEHLMEFDRNNFIPETTTLLEAEFDEEASTYYYYLGNDFIGSCSICDETSIINIYNVYVEPEYRNRGYGSEIISDVLWDLVNSDKKIQLQVSGHNHAALKLYGKCGFTITDTVVLYSRESQENTI